MALRPRGLSRPPATEDAPMGRYLQEIREALDGLPFSFFSTADGPNTSGVTAPRGVIGVEIGSSSNTILWVKENDSSLTTGWEAVALDNAFGAMYHAFDNSVATQSTVTTAFQQYRGFDTLGISSKLSSAFDQFTVRQGGIYEANFNISMTGKNNTRYDFELHKNTVDQRYGFTLDTGSAGDIGNGAFNSIITASSGDTVAVYVKSDDAGGAEVVTHAANFILKEISSE